MLHRALDLALALLECQTPKTHTLTTDEVKPMKIRPLQDRLIVKRVAERHGGKAWVRPREGGGSEFIITFGSSTSA